MTVEALLLAETTTSADGFERPVGIDEDAGVQGFAGNYGTYEATRRFAGVVFFETAADRDAYLSRGDVQDLPDTAVANILNAHSEVKRSASEWRDFLGSN